MEVNKSHLIIALVGITAYLGYKRMSQLWNPQPSTTSASSTDLLIANVSPISNTTAVSTTPVMTTTQPIMSSDNIPYATPSYTDDSAVGIAGLG